MQKIKTWLSNVQLIQGAFQIKHVHCADMQNVLAQAPKRTVPGGNHGVIYVTRPSNILIGNLRHLHAVAPKVYDKKSRNMRDFYLCLFTNFFKTLLLSRHNIINRLFNAIAEFICHDEQEPKYTHLFGVDTYCLRRLSKNIILPNAPYPYRKYGAFA